MSQKYVPSVIDDVLTYRLIDPVSQILLKWYQLAALRRVQPLVVELELFLFRRGSRHVGAIKDGNRGRSPATAITGVLGGREAVGVRHSEAAPSGVARRILSRCFFPRSPWVLFQDPLHFLRQFPGYSRTMSCRGVRHAIKCRLKSRRRLPLSRDGGRFRKTGCTPRKLIESENAMIRRNMNLFLENRGRIRYSRHG